VNVVEAVVSWVVSHPGLVVGYVPLLLWGHTWQRAGRIESRWSWPLLGLVVLGVAYWRSPKFRAVVHAVLICGWVYVLRLVGWPGRMVWLTVSYWALLLRAVSLIRVRNIAAGVPLNLTSYRLFRGLRQYRKAAKQATDVAHAEAALVGYLAAGHNGALRGMVRPAPGKSLIDLQEAATRGALGASWNHFARTLGLDPMHRVLVRDVGGAQGEGEIIGLPDDPLKAEFMSPSVVAR
jgi:hypothetical protein